MLGFLDARIMFCQKEKGNVILLLKIRDLCAQNFIPSLVLNLHLPFP